MKKLLLPQITPEGKTAMSHAGAWMLFAAVIFLIAFALISCTPTTETNPPELKIEFSEVCGEKTSPIAVDELTIYKLQIGSDYDTIRHPYQGHTGNVPTITMLGLSGKYEVVATFRQIARKQVVDWLNNQDISIKFKFKSARCREMKGGNQ